MLSVILLIVIFILAYKVTPRNNHEEEHKHGAGQIGLLVAVSSEDADKLVAASLARHQYGVKRVMGRVNTPRNDGCSRLILVSM